jgi:predicted aspartyl protease
LWGRRRWRLPGFSVKDAIATTDSIPDANCSNLVNAGFVSSVLNKMDNKRPFVTILFSGVSISALLDTGASISLISKSIATTLPGYHSFKRLPCNIFRARTANDTIIAFIGLIEIPLSIGNKKFKHHFYVTNAEAGTILGIDFVKRHRVSRIEGDKLDLYGHTEIFSIGDDSMFKRNLTPEPFEVKVACDTELKPMSIHVITVKSDLTGTDAFIESNNSTEPGILPVEGMSQFSKKGTGSMIIVNKEPVFKSLPKGSCVGYALPFEEECFEIAAINSTVKNNESRKKKDVKKSKPEEVEQLLRQANISAPQN